jgi:hypothetical protein
VAFAVFIAAGAFAWRAFGGTGRGGSEPTLSPSPAAAPGTLVLDLSSHDNAPSFSINFEGAVQEGIRQGYSWCPSGSGDGQGCVSGIGDFAYYPPVTEYLPVAGGTTLQVSGDAESFQVEVSDGEGTPIRDAAVADGSLVAPSPGRYVWNVKGTWSQGDGNAFFGLEVLPPVDQIPDVLHVTCTPERATADGTVVRAQADGVHIAIDASADVTGADVVRGASPEDFVGIGADAPQDGSLGIGLDPGGWGIGCYTGSRGSVSPYDIHTERVAGFTVVDPDDRYAESNLTCEDPSTTNRATGLEATGETPSADATRGELAGLIEGDVVRGAGYGAWTFKLGPTYVVQRGDDTIARITLGSLPGGSTWGATLDVCPGAGIDVAPTDAATAPDTPAPDVAVLRCTGGGPELDTPIVSVQPDGLHIDAKNLANAFMIDLELEGGGNLGTVAFDGADHREVVLGVPPGQVTMIGCLYRDGDNVVARGSDDHPEWYVPIEITDPAGLYVSSELACGQADQVSIGPEGNVIIMQPARESDVRATISGILPSDVVELDGYAESTLRSRTWLVVREGEVLARISEPFVEGQACAGSGIGGA